MHPYAISTGVVIDKTGNNILFGNILVQWYTYNRTTTSLAFFTLLQHLVLGEVP